jgi:ABC-type spermidine/putrescine transport system permease subunit II
MAIGANTKSPRTHSSYNVALWIYAGLVYFYLYGPLIMIIVLSFNNSEIIGFPMEGFSFRWYEVVFSSPRLIFAFINSLGVGFLAASIATSIAVLLSLAFRHDFPGKNLTMTLIVLPIVIPGVIGGIVLLIFFGYIGIHSSLWTTVLVGHVNWILPFAFLTLYPRIIGLDRSIEEAAMDLGARPRVVFTKIILPIIRPAILATALFSFSLSFDEFVRTIFLIGFERTLPVQFWNMIVDEMAPELPAMAVFIMTVSISVSLLGFSLFSGAKTNGQKRK